MSNVIILRSNPVAPDPRVEKIIRTVIKAGHVPTILCWDRSHSNQIIEESAVEGVAYFRICIESGFGRGLIRNLKPMVLFQLKLLFWLLLNNKRYSNVYACDLDTALVAYVIKLLLKKSFIYDIFDYYPDSFPLPGFVRPLIKRIDWLVMNNASSVFVCSEGRKSQIGIVPKQGVSVVHNTPDITMLPNMVVDPYKTGFLRIAYVGILSPNRRLDYLLDLVSTHDNIFLNVAGFGPLEGFVVQKANCCNRIIYHGKVDYSTTLAIESASDVIWALYDPSIANHRYAAPNKFYESLMLGRHLIMLRNTGMDKDMSLHNFGTVIDDSFESITEAILALRDGYIILDDPRRLRLIYQQYYRWEVSESVLIRAIAKLCGESIARL